ncbi:hypothetical protein BY458DRAFT_489322 [Sporodiniella umbellata]|nr:hypothetical protein BY458DRAFT_489322 [Sporodiniella umbellata]
MTILTVSKSFICFGGDVGVGVVSCFFSLTMEEDIGSWYLPFERRCGTDLTTKVTLNNKTIINIIVHELLGSDVPNSIYIPGSTEWPDDTRSGAIYIPKNEVTDDLPPILVEVQHQVDQRFMLRLIKYCANIYERYEVLPVVLVFLVEKFSNTILEKSFIAKESALYRKMSLTNKIVYFYKSLVLIWGLG